MAVQKIYAGARLREMRARVNLSQKDFAERLGISLPYLNQMENNNRPVSAQVVMALAREFGFDVAELHAGDEARLVSDLREVLADPVFTGPMPDAADLRLVAGAAPGLARAFLGLHAAYQQTQERLASLDEAFVREDLQLTPSPWEEVRDFFHYCDNYIDMLDRAAEALASEGDDVEATTMARLEDHKIRVTAHDGPQYLDFDADTRVLSVSRQMRPQTRRFQLLVAVAALCETKLLNTAVKTGGFQSIEAWSIAKTGLANYFAGAAIMPYGRFHEAAAETRHDLEVLALRFGASLEQVAHRLSTLQRPGARGVPFFFVRVDPAGTITKRHSATQLQFARYGGACPLWNVHRAFETPGRWLRQLAVTPDGVRYFCLARDVTRPAGAFGAPVRRLAIGLGCEMRHAGALVYSDHMETDDPGAYEEIGVSCRICPRADCAQRSVPSLERPQIIDLMRRGVHPYPTG